MGGVQLKQEDLAEEFGVSRIPIREALKRLEAEGLIKHILNKGSVVASHSIAEIIEMLDIRIALETRALALAIPLFDNSHYLRSKRILERYDKAINPGTWAKLNLDFHLSIYQASNKPRLLKMIEEVVLSNQRYVRTYISNTLGRDEPQKEHYELLAAMKERDRPLALSILEAHLTHTQTALLNVARN